MSFAIIQTGGKQYKVSASEILKIERLKDDEGKTVEFKNILFLKHFFKNNTFLNGFSHIFENSSKIHLKILLKFIFEN